MRVAFSLLLGGGILFCNRVRDCSVLALSSLPNDNCPVRNPRHCLGSDQVNTHLMVVDPYQQENSRMIYPIAHKQQFLARHNHPNIPQLGFYIDISFAAMLDILVNSYRCMSRHAVNFSSVSRCKDNRNFVSSQS